MATQATPYAPHAAATIEASHGADRSWTSRGLQLALLLDGGLHIWAAVQHAAYAPGLGAVMALAGGLQIGLAAYVARRPNRVAYLAVVASSVALLALHAAALTTGLPVPGSATTGSVTHHTPGTTAHGHGTTAHGHAPADLGDDASHLDQFGALGGASKALELAAIALAVTRVRRRVLAPCPRVAPRTALLVASGLAALTLAACAGPGPAAGGAAAQSAAGPPVETTIKLFAFQPAALNVPAGTSVTWSNQDDIPHSVTHGAPGAPGGAFDSGLFDVGAQYSHTFATAGEYAYFCTRHPHMRGVVQVGGA